MSDASGVLRLPQVEMLIGMSRSSIYRLERLGRFPERVKISDRAVGWRRDQLERWLASRPTARSSTPAA